MRKFKNRVVVITGAGSGIGRAIARAFAERGARLHLLDLHGYRVEELAGELRLMAVEAHAHTVDVRDPQAMEAVAQEVYERHGRCHVLVNNAGVGHGSYVHEMTLDDWKWVLDTNLWGVIHGIHAFVPRMIDQGGDAHIVNMASVLGLLAVPTMAPYCASKFAIVGLSESLSMELAPFGIGVSAICPGFIDTSIVRDGRMGRTVSLGKQRVLEFYRKRAMPPERVARDVLLAVRRRRPLQLTLGGVYPAFVLKRLSPSLYRGAARFVAKQFLGS
jgi:NAD(P)-dependent dehydrogenase (short-subunit alcohol dehydrogenase family)